MPHDSVSSATVFGRSLPRVRLTRGDVHRHRQVDPALAPRALLAQRLVEHPFRQRFDQRAAVGLGHERVGHQQSARGVLPAHQRLDADDPHRPAQLDLGLEVQHELAARDAVAQLAQQREPALGLILRLGAEDAEAAARGLGLVQRQVGPAQQVGGRAAVLREEGDPEARLHRDVATGDPERLLERGAQVPGHGRRGLDVGLARGQDAEGVALQAGHGVGVAHGSAKPLGDRLQHEVADFASVALVDLAEAVEVEHRARRAASSERSARAIDRSIRSENSARFGSPVSSSCSARCSSASV